jgi:hypothetical protein
MSYVHMNEERQYLLMQKIVDHIAVHAYDIKTEVGDEEYDKLYDDLSVPIRSALEQEFGSKRFNG